MSFKWCCNILYLCNSRRSQHSACKQLHIENKKRGIESFNQNISENNININIVIRYSLYSFQEICCLNFFEFFYACSDFIKKWFDGYNIGADFSKHFEAKWKNLFSISNAIILFFVKRLFNISILRGKIIPLLCLDWYATKKSFLTKIMISSTSDII